MANAKQCDRCKKLYCLHERTPDITVKKYHHGFGVTEYDLCDQCNTDLEKFLNNAKVIAYK